MTPAPPAGAPPAACAAAQAAALVAACALAMSAAAAQQARPTTDAPPAAGVAAETALAQAAPAGGATSGADDGQAALPARRRPTTRGFRPVLRTGVDAVVLEASQLPDAPEAVRTASLRASPYVLWQPVREWEFRAGAQVQGDDQAGSPAAYGRWRAELGETYARFRRGDTRITLGAQTIVWGRVDAVPLIDRVSRADLTRFALDELPERRLPQPALRWEQTLGEVKLDLVALPGFRGALLPDARSVWSPVNRVTGEIIGIRPSPALAALVQAARLREDDRGAGGAAARLTYATGGALDLGLTLARTRQSLPYYRADPVARTLTAVHPYVRFAGVDAELATDRITWRTELGWSADVPVTALDGAMLRRDAIDWVGGMEFFAGDETRVTLQLTARRISGAAPIQELARYSSANGEVETTFGQGRWKAALRFNAGLNVHDVYLAPRLAYAGWEPHEVYLVRHHFDGAARTFGGFHRHHGTLALGLKTRF